MPRQKDVCKKHNAIPIPCRDEEKLGIAIETIGKAPINGLRHKPENGTCGWYIWCGEELKEEDDEFFKPLHVGHIKEYLPEIEQFLSLPPGYRFLVAGNYEDVWYDKTLINL